MSVFNNYSAHTPVAEAACLWLTLGNGHGEGVAAGGIEPLATEVVGEVEVHRLGGGARTPAAAREIAAGHAVPEISAHWIPLAVASAVAAPWGESECGFAIDK